MNRLFCNNVLIISIDNVDEGSLSVLAKKFKFSSPLGDKYRLLSDEIIHETASKKTTFSGYGIADNLFINSQTYQAVDFSEDYVGNYVYVEFDESSSSVAVKTDFFTNAMKFIYQSPKIVIFSNNLSVLLDAIGIMKIQIEFNYDHINFNLRLALEVSESKNYFPYFNQFTLEKSEIIGYSYVKPFYDILLDKNKTVSYVKKEVVSQRDQNMDLDSYIRKSKDEMTNALKVISKQFPNHDVCADLTAGADSRCLLSLFLEFDVHDVNYYVQIKSNKGIASIGMTDAYYFEYFRERFNLRAVDLSKYNSGHFGEEEYRSMEQHFFQRNPHQYQGMSNNLIYDDLLLLRGGYGEIFRNYLGFECENELDGYFRRQINSTELYKELKSFLNKTYSFITEDLCKQHNLNYIFYRQRETVVYNKINYPFYNLLQSKNMFFAKSSADLSEDNYALLKRFYIKELREVNINDRSMITNSVKTSSIDIDYLYNLKQNQEAISLGLIVNKKFGNNFFINELLSNLDYLTARYQISEQNTEHVINLVNSIDKNKGTFNNWRIKNLHYRLKKIRHMLESTSV